jgi:hypothetical protein
MHHGLLVAEQIVRQSGVLLKRLSDAGNIAVAKDSETSFKEPSLLAIALGELILEKPDDSLGRGDASFHGAMLLTVIIFRSVSHQ